MAKGLLVNLYYFGGSVSIVRDLSLLIFDFMKVSLVLLGIAEHHLTQCLKSSFFQDCLKAGLT